jgi:oligosaccharyltransferase complex subunit gamma
MRWLKSLLPLTLLSLSTPILAAKKDASTEDKFKTWHSKALSSAPVKLDDAKYKDLTKTPRDYAVAVLLTAMEPRFGCQLCREFQPEWDLLGRSWTRGDKSGASRLVYGTLDFAEGRDTFMSVSASVGVVHAQVRNTGC